MSTIFEDDINQVFKILNDKSEKKVLKATKKQIIDIYNEFIKPNKNDGKNKKLNNKENKKSDDDKVKRPKSSWMYYSMENKKKIKDENPDKKMAEITIMMKQLWKEISKEDKHIYEEKAEKDKIRYNNEKVDKK
jgi:hypothetical protein